MRRPTRRNATLLATLLFCLAGSAFAEDEFDVSVSADGVKVLPKGGWHINKEYPWKLTIGDTTLDKTKWSLDETKATVSGPKGKGKIKGGVCNGGQCLSFEKPVEIQ